MLTHLKRWSTAVADGVPPLLVCGALAGVAYWGAANGWQASKFAVMFPKVAGFLGLSAAEAAEGDDKPVEGPAVEKAEGPADWCEKHGVSDTLCPVCHPELLARADGGISPGELPIQTA